MARKRKITLKKIKKAAVDEGRKAHNQLRIITIAAYIILFASWLILNYELLYLVIGIVAIMFIRIGVALWLYKRISSKEK